MIQYVASRIAIAARARRIAIIAHIVATAMITTPLRARAQDTAILPHTDSASFNRDPVLIHSARDDARLARVFAEYIRAMPPLPGIRPRNQSTRIDLYLADSERTFAALTAGAAPHWGAGIAVPDSGIIVLPAYTSRRAGVQDLGPVLRHEFAHVELQRSLGSLRIPLWFTEGYAVWSSGQLDPDAAWYLRMAFLTHRAPPLDSLELDWPAREIDARVAYLLSASAVAYLNTLGDAATFTRFLDAWRNTGSMENALRSTYLISSTQFERLWLRHVRRTYGWLLFLAQGAVVWTFFTAVAVGMIIIRRRRDRRRLEAMRRTDLPDTPAFWDPDSEPEPDGAESPQDGAAEEPPRE